MKKIIASLAAAAAVTAVAAPAVAQPYDYGRPGYGHDQRGYDHRGYDNRGFDRREERLENRIERGVRRGDLTPREADRLLRELSDLQRLEIRFRRDGLSGWERAELDRRYDRLEARLQYERRDREYGYGYRR